jgi:hypothetical protein
MGETRDTNGEGDAQLYRLNMTGHKPLTGLTALPQFVAVDHYADRYLYYRTTEIQSRLFDSMSPPVEVLYRWRLPEP